MQYVQRGIKIKIWVRASHAWNHFNRPAKLNYKPLKSILWASDFVTLSFGKVNSSLVLKNVSQNKTEVVETKLAIRFAHDRNFSSFPRIRNERNIKSFYSSSVLFACLFERPLVICSWSPPARRTISTWLHFRFCPFVTHTKAKAPFKRTSSWKSEALWKVALNRKCKDNFLFLRLLSMLRLCRYRM